MYNSRGIALISVLFVLVIIVILIGSLLTFIPAELRQVAFSGFDNRALYAADAGVEAETESIQTGTAGLGAGTLVAPDASTATYNGTVLATGSVCGVQEKLIQSIGTSPAGDQRQVAAVLAQTTLANFGLWVNNNPNGVYLVSGYSHYNGAVYLGGAASDPQLVNYIVGNTAIFDNQVTFAGNSGVNWYNNGNSTSMPAQNNGPAWAAIDAAGYSLVTVNGQTQPYPGAVQSIQLANNAFGTPSNTTYPAPKTKTVYMNQQAAGGPGGTLSSGIYVQGDSTVTMASSAVNSTPSTMTWTFNPVKNDSNSIVDQVTVTVNYTSNSTVINDPVTKKSTTYTGVPSQTNGTSSNSGIVFDYGNVLDVAGTYNGQYTLAVPDDGTTNDFIYIASNVVAHDNPQTNALSNDNFGLYANDVYIDDQAKGVPFNLTIQAALVTGNATEVAKASNDGTFATRDDASGLPLYGTVNLYGSLAENIYGETYTWSGNNHLTGWAKNFLSDPRFSTCPPPGSPIVNNTWHLVAWKDQGTP